jgi:hypothetical protein
MPCSTAFRSFKLPNSNQLRLERQIGSFPFTAFLAYMIGLKSASITTSAIPSARITEE